MAGRLVLAGAGHAHMTILSRIASIRERGHEVTVIGPSEHHYYSGMGPGMLGGTYTPEQIRFPVKQMTESQGGKFILDRVVRVDAKTKELLLDSGLTVGFDVATFNTGSHVPTPIADPGEPDLYTVKPIENLLHGRKRIQELAQSDEVAIGVVGGGPAALEVAGNAWAASLQSGGKGGSIRIYAGRRFLSHLPEGVRDKALKVFKQRKITIVEGSYVSRVTGGVVQLEDDRQFRDKVIFLALGVKPSPLFTDSGLPTGPDGGLLVNEFLQCMEHPDLFGGGDCIYFQNRPLDKVGVYAVRENPILAENVLARLEGRALTPFDPGGNYLLIFNLGDGKGVFHKSGIVFNGKPAFWAKDYIDRKFIRKFHP
ncbi:MAG: NAD(P)/FAD-dependent oxidoreductase [Desulfovibrionales bacterium]